ncbi:hypothetical protein CTI12_AA258630 [Artemisia annua]|uniref:Uncharacterized protein n=1 Tax=Artemisia annua TaxID=35608 RepID=A0A2U1NJM2_ARTAN|nr:hypothetical protein CTI12_AA258630 [Artemisia annua]
MLFPALLHLPTSKVPPLHLLQEIPLTHMLPTPSHQSKAHKKNHLTVEKEKGDAQVDPVAVKDRKEAQNWTKLNPLTEKAQRETLEEPWKAYIKGPPHLAKTVLVFL